MFGLSPLALRLGLIVGIAALLVWGGLHLRSSGYAACERDHKAAAFDREVIEDKALRAAAAAISDLTVVQKTIHQKLEREVREKVIYRDTACALDDDGMRLINAQLEGTARSSSADKLPKTDKVTGQLLRGGDIEALGDGQPVQPMPEGSIGGE
jgi:hypothetical protein